MTALRRGLEKDAICFFPATNKPLCINISLDYSPLLICIRISYPDLTEHAEKPAMKHPQQGRNAHPLRDYSHAVSVEI